MVIAGVGELEDRFIPDVDPRTGKLVRSKYGRKDLARWLLSTDKGQEVLRKIKESVRAS